MQKRRAIVWFRQDLRLHDNEALTDALANAEEVAMVFVFDERVFTDTTRFGFAKTGKYRAQFIIEAVQDLRQSLRKLDSDLIVRVGKPETIIYELAKELKTSWVFCNRERTREEVKVQDDLERNLWSIGQEVRYSRGKMLYYTADLPFPVTHTPDTFTQFRKEVERVVPIREPLPAPLKPLTKLGIQIIPGDIPSIADFGHDPIEPEPRSVLSFKGGETAGVERLHYYFWESRCVQTYKETRNELIGGDYSSKFSPWLAQGCLSPKTIYRELRKFEAAHGANESTYWIFFELMWRDFFRFMGKKHGDKIFLKGGTTGAASALLRNDYRLLQKWIDGLTGVPFIDANMRELKLTGFISNRGRQNVASFLVKDLFVNWQMGAEYFESMLIDYDPCSNWGNWNYIAGVGSDPRENRYFNILSQARRYDPKGEYVKRWLPELANVPLEKIHRPDTLTFAEQDLHRVKLGDDYPTTVVEMEKWEH
ncbi:MAG: DASH family cryptochrome [Saprospiraceae bacterium]|nr:DASH family cryptochrome [Saprospiraceae bacterium]